MRKAVKTAASAFRILPMRKDLIMFESYSGRSLWDSPRCVHDYLKEHYPGRFELVFAYRGKAPASAKVKTVRYNSLRWIRLRLTAGALVTNSNPPTYLPSRKGQIVMNTWHAGGAYKKTGFASELYRAEGAEADLSTYRVSELNRQITVFLTSSDIFTKYNIREGYGYEGEVLRTGLPRNDIFFDKPAACALREKVRKKLGVKGVCVLYAPTYRGDLTHADEVKTVPDLGAVKRAVEERFHDDCTILRRMHYADRHDYSDHVTTDVFAYPRMQDLLLAADLLITDYSSSIWDFSLLGKPCFLYVPDLRDYTGGDRSFFLDIGEWPGTVCADMDELTEAIRSLDEERSREAARAHQQAAGSCENGRASETAAEYIAGRLEA